VATDPSIAFCVREHDEPALEVRVNFGVFAGRSVTAAEIDELARQLHHELDEFSVIAEERHEFAGSVEASVHQVRVEVSRDAVSGQVTELCDRVVGIAEAWAEACIADRHSDLVAEQLDPYAS
jgi:hypothetical protein